MSRLLDRRIGKGDKAVLRLPAGVSGARPERRAADFADQVLDRAAGGQRLVPAVVGLGDLQMTEESHPQLGLAQIPRLVVRHPILEAPFLVVVSHARRGREGERLDAAAVEQFDLDGARFVFQGFEEVDALEIDLGESLDDNSRRKVRTGSSRSMTSSSMSLSRNRPKKKKRMASRVDFLGCV